MKSITSKRITALLLDIIFIYLLIGVISNIRFINPTYDKYVESYDKYTNIMNDYANNKITIDEFNEKANNELYYITKYSISTNIVIIVVLVGYFSIFQKYNKGQTLGKKIMNIKVISNDKKNISIIKYILRTSLIYYIFIGNIISLILSSIFILVFDQKTFILLNTIVTYLMFSLLVISIILVLFRKDNKTLHDIITNTSVK